MSDDFLSIDAFYTFLESLIQEVGSDSPLSGAQSFRSLRASVDEAERIIRVDYFSGKFVPANEAAESEREVKLVVECFVTPKDDSEMELQRAKIESTRMAKAIFMAYATQIGWTNACDVQGDEFDADVASFGTVLRGATYLYPTVNP